jgi:hypothetical protein
MLLRVPTLSLNKTFWLWLWKGILDISVPGHFGTDLDISVLGTGHFGTDLDISVLDSSGLGWDNIRYWPQLFGTY